MTPPDPDRLAWYEMNDTGNAERLRDRVQGLLRWVDMGEGSGYWIGFDGQRWSRKDGTRRARAAAQDVASAMAGEVRALADMINSGKMPPNMVKAMGEERAKEHVQARLVELRKWAIKSGNRAQTDNMLAQAQVLLGIYPDDFDPDPYALNLRNGTLRFVPPSIAGRAPSGTHRYHVETRGGHAALRPCGPDGAPSGEWAIRLDPHDPADLITRMAEVEFDPAAECPGWLARLEHLQPEADQREMMRRIQGYALLGVRSEQKWVVAQGRGGDGKSLSYVVLAEIMGDYYRHADVQSFLKGGTKSGSDHSEDLARLAGDTRFVTCDEPERFATWNGKILKQMTSGSKMTVRALRQASMEIEPRWLLLVECNPFPRPPTSDDGFWRRCLPFQWPVQLTQAEQVAQPFDVLKASLLKERSGILNWMIGGAIAWLGERDLKPSARSMEVKENYRNTSDPFTEWYRTRCVTGDPDDKSLRAKGSDLHANFKTFCEEELGIDGAKVPGLRAFGTQLDERQHPNRKSMGNKWRLGIRLKDDAELLADADAAERVAQGGSNMAGDDGPPPGWR